MCIIFGGNNAPLAEVKCTKIFIAPLSNGNQLTIYENQVSLQSAMPVEGSAMILPVPAGTIQLLDLSDSSKSQMVNLFHNLKQAFPVVQVRRPAQELAKLRSVALSAIRNLAVREIGNYFVSIASCLEDIALIDPSKFRVPQDIQQVLATNYGDGSWSFVICRFKSVEVRPHPIGYVHERHQDGKMFVPTRHAHGSQSDHPSIRSWIADQFRGEEHDDWDHELYIWGCEDVMQLIDGHRSVTEAGETPGEMEDRLRRRMRELPMDGYTFYNLIKGVQVRHSASLLNEMLTNNNSAQLTMPSRHGLELVDTLRFREIKPSSRSKDDFTFQPAQFGGPGLDMPNADLILTVNKDHLETMPEPISKDERVAAVTAIRNDWIIGSQSAALWSEEDDTCVHTSTHLYAVGRGVALYLIASSITQAILGLALCRRRKDLHASLDSVL